MSCQQKLFLSFSVKLTENDLDRKRFWMTPVVEPAGGTVGVGGNQRGGVGCCTRGLGLGCDTIE